jgi:poly(hydroxyalkanoate) depolymerase family esterase
VLVLALVLAGCGQHSAPRSLVHGHVTVDGRTYSYAVHVPAGLTAGQPLLVVLHGCRTTADQQAAVSRYSPQLLVLYPDVDAADARASNCWRAAWTPQSERRGRGDAGAIAAMTRMAIRRFAADRNRVYVIGMSAGGFETSILGAAYPDLFAAIAIHSGVAYMDTTCPATGDQQETIAALAGAALVAMGPRARVVPTLVIHGDRDNSVSYACGLEALAQWIETNDSVLVGAHRPPLPDVPRIRLDTVPHGHGYTVADYPDAAGCPVAELVTVDGMGHAWSGGSSAKRLRRYSDPRGPSAAALSWAFFSRWRRGGECHG